MSLISSTGSSPTSTATTTPSSATVVGPTESSGQRSSLRSPISAPPWRTWWSRATASWARFVYRGTHNGELMGVPASGNTVELRTIDIWRVEDGMFVEHWDELNLLEVFQQVGALPSLGGSPVGEA